MEYLEENKDLDEYVLPYVTTPFSEKIFSEYEGNKSVVEIGDNSNNNLSHAVHVDIPEYQVQEINVNKLKDKIRNRKNLCILQTHYQ